MAPTNLSETLTNHVNSYSFHFQYNFFFLGKILLKSTFVLISYSIEVPYLELVSTALNHFGVIAGLFQQIGGHSSRFVLHIFLFLKTFYYKDD